MPKDRVTDALSQLIGALSGLLIPTPVNRELTYDQAIGWFIDERPANGTAQRGAIMRADMLGARIEIVQVFLNEKNEPLNGPDKKILGRRLIVHGLDEELSDAFGTADLLIVG